MAKIVCTGIAGFIGSHLADKLLADGHEVYGIDNLSTGKAENVTPKANFILHDLTDAKKTEEIIAKIKPDYVFHLAALARIQPSIEDPIRWNDHNTNATLNLLWACHKAGVKRVIYAGSSSVYGLANDPPYKENMIPNPMNPYAMAKLFGENYCKMFNDLYELPTTVFRFFNVYGPRQVLEGDYATVIGIFLKQKENEENLTIVGDGTQKRDFTYVKDIVSGLMSALDYKGDFNVFNLGTGTNYEIQDVARLIEPDESKWTTGLVRRAEAKETRADISKAKKLLGWEPKYNLEEGINETNENKVRSFV